MKDWFVLPRPGGVPKWRPGAKAVKCDSNLLRVVTERVEATHPSLAFTQKAALELALIDWLEGGKADAVALPDTSGKHRPQVKQVTSGG
ncbi:hypothetical protein [Cyanobium sp. BA5m-10]|uniref:hypothetical protein n=1 Tax=Cyanobium sp. BA5m-10 TaxID=2823705 RepID=UPI0020CF813F|nr:hypothetical protein [Cyanobium sp. BA5m-10]